MMPESNRIGAGPIRRMSQRSVPLPPQGFLDPDPLMPLHLSIRNGAYVAFDTERTSNLDGMPRLRRRARPDPVVDMHGANFQEPEPPQRGEPSKQRKRIRAAGESGHDPNGSIPIQCRERPPQALNKTNFPSWIQPRRVRHHITHREPR